MGKTLQEPHFTQSPVTSGEGKKNKSKSKQTKTTIVKMTKPQFLVLYLSLLKTLLWPHVLTPVRCWNLLNSPIVLIISHTCINFCLQAPKHFYWWTCRIEQAMGACRSYSPSYPSSGVWYFISHYAESRRGRTSLNVCIHLGEDGLVSTIVIPGDREHRVMHPSTEDGMKSMASDQAE